MNHKLYRRALLHGGDFNGLKVVLMDGDSTPSVFFRKYFSLSENSGLGIPAAKDLKIGVT